MNFGAIKMPHLNNYSLDSLDFPRGILVILPGLVFFLGSTEQYKAMKIGITFFGSKMDLLDTWCIRGHPEYYHSRGFTVHWGTGGTFRRCFRKGFEMACCEGGFRVGFRNRFHHPKA